KRENNESGKDYFVFGGLFQGGEAEVRQQRQQRRSRNCLNASIRNLQTKCSNQAFDWGRREPYLRLAHVFDTNSY
ncbi:hypothetical protein COOONC_18778, partial [Cooperia oncophora]